MPPKATRKRKASQAKTRSSARNKKEKVVDLESERYVRDVEACEAKAKAKAKASADRDSDSDSDEETPMKERRCSRCHTKFACEVGIKGKVQCYDCHAAAMPAIAVEEETKEKKHDPESESDIEAKDDDEEYEEESRHHHQQQESARAAYQGAAESFRKDKEERDQRLIKKCSRNHRACPFVVFDQVKLSVAGVKVLAGQNRIDENTVFVVTAIEPVYNFPVAKWNIRVKKFSGDAFEYFYPIYWFELYAKHNDLTGYKQCI